MLRIFPVRGVAGGEDHLDEQGERLVGFMALRQLPRMVRHWSSLQSWMTWREQVGVMPFGTDSKKLPGSMVTRPSRPRCFRNSGAPATTWGRSKRTPRA